MSDNRTTLPVRLTPGQRSTLLGLDGRYQVLGCGEATAIRLCTATATRPALVEEGPRSAEGWRTFRLTGQGLAAQKGTHSAN